MKSEAHGHLHACLRHRETEDPAFHFSLPCPRLQLLLHHTVMPSLCLSLSALEHTLPLLLALGRSSFYSQAFPYIPASKCASADRCSNASDTQVEQLRVFSDPLNFAPETGDTDEARSKQETSATRQRTPTHLQRLRSCGALHRKSFGIISMRIYACFPCTKHFAATAALHERAERTPALHCMFHTGRMQSNCRCPDNNAQKVKQAYSKTIQQLPTMCMHIN